MRVSGIAQLLLGTLVLWAASSNATLISFDQMEGVNGCDRTYWIGDGLSLTSESCAFDHLTWGHTVVFDEPVQTINSMSIEIQFWDDDADTQCVLGVCVPWQPEFGAVLIGSTSFLPTLTYDIDALLLDIEFDYNFSGLEIDTGTESFAVPGIGSLINGGTVGVRVQGASPTSLQDFKVNGSTLFVDYTPASYNEVPEPGTLVLFGIGMLGMGIMRLRRI